ncbi:Hypothetical predicted protein [Mytilus galloprovincialis]|uniref:C-type lectin domain-containing protein n=1 Tax=Mytilus galloprovincialis TaxID=29158 RepID=A0A8B6DRR1_MYTGA|nr:Hypothetical predicted protein [Mytilus galloprovincialis]
MMDMVVTFSVFIAAVLLQGIFATGFSDRWSVVHEQSECNIIDWGSDLKKIYDTKDSMYCASHCTTTDGCSSFEYNSVNAVCRLFAYPITRNNESSCTPGNKVYSYRRWKDGCSDPGYAYHESHKICLSFPTDTTNTYYWDEAQPYCEAKNESFLIIDIVPRLRVARDIIDMRPRYDLMTYWVGGRRGTDGVFRWIDGTEMPPTNTWYWFKDPANDLTWDCVAIHKWAFQQKYYVLDCDVQKGLFFCEKFYP